jgi:hypothetical protein
VFYDLGESDKTEAGSYGLKSDAIDGKTVRGSFNTRQGNKAIRLGHGEPAGIRPGKDREKSNEITAIPALLEKIALKGCIVTIDASD